MESEEQRARPAWIDVWRWSAVFACIGLVPGHLYVWYQLADGLNAEFWGLLLLTGLLGGALGAIVGTIVCVVCRRNGRSLSSWLAFGAVIPPMLIGQFAFAMIGGAVASSVARATVVSVGGLIGGCLGAWLVPTYAIRSSRNAESLSH